MLADGPLFTTACKSGAGQPTLPHQSLSSAHVAVHFCATMGGTVQLKL
jgi:hypothetical protein